MGYLFLVTNHADSGRRYVGYTTRGLSQVRASYYTQAKRYGDNKGSAFFEAIRKHPKADFEWSLISEEIKDLDELKRQRIRMIDRLGTADPERGYNVRDGISVDPTIRSQRPPKFVCVETGEFFSSTYAIQKATGKSRQKIGQWIKEGRPIEGKTYKQLSANISDVTFD